jgi:ABC-type antimicrobial peptide transport system permease subunit
MVVRQGFQVLAPGLLLGTAGALALTRLLAAQLHGVEPHDPLTLLAAGCLLLGTGLLACWGPASRAAKINPRTILLDD